MSEYIGLEGVEGSGKSTVAHILAELLSAGGSEVVVVREPGGTSLGEEVRQVLLHSNEMVAWAEAALFAAQRAQLAVEIIAPALARGAWVISDRTYYSSLAYQGGARGLGIDEVRALNERVLQGVVPDIVAVIDIDPDVGLARQADPDRIGSGGSEFFAMVSAAYHQLASEEPGRVHLVDPGGSPEEVAQRILGLIRARRG